MNDYKTSLLELAEIFKIKWISVRQYEVAFGIRFNVLEQ